MILKTTVAFAIYMAIVNSMMFIGFGVTELFVISYVNFFTILAFVLIVMNTYEGNLLPLMKGVMFFILCFTAVNYITIVILGVSGIIALLSANTLTGIFVFVILEKFDKYEYEVEEEEEEKIIELPYEKAKNAFVKGRYD